MFARLKKWAIHRYSLWFREQQANLLEKSAVYRQHRVMLGEMLKTPPPSLPAVKLHELQSQKLDTQNVSFSIVICTYNRADSLRQTLLSLRKLRFPKIETIVVVGPCTDHTAKVIEEFGNEIHTAHCPEANISLARNMGIAAASGKLIAFIDDDATPEPDWITEILKEFNDPAIGASGGYILSADGVSYQSKYLTVDTYGKASHFDELAAFTKAIKDTNLPCPTGTNMVFRADLLRALGGFDPTYRYMLDETDLIYRIHRAGWGISLSPTAIVHHKFAPAEYRTKAKIPTNQFDIHKSTSFYINKLHRQSLDDEEILEHLSNTALERFSQFDWWAKIGKITTEQRDGFKKQLLDGQLAGLDIEATPLTAIPAPEESPRQAKPHNPVKSVLIIQDHKQLADAPAEVPSSPDTLVTEFIINSPMIHQVAFFEDRWIHHLPPELSNTASIQREIERVAQHRQFDTIVVTDETFEEKLALPQQHRE